MKDIFKDTINFFQAYAEASQRVYAAECDGKLSGQRAENQKEYLVDCQEVIVGFAGVGLAKGVFGGLSLGSIYFLHRNPLVRGVAVAGGVALVVNLRNDLSKVVEAQGRHTRESGKPSGRSLDLSGHFNL